MATIEQQNRLISVEVPGSNNNFFSVSGYNNISYIQCNSLVNSTGNVYIRTYNSVVVESEEIRMFFDSVQNFQFSDMNIPIKTGIRVDNGTNQSVMCNFLVNNYDQNYRQQFVQDYGLSIINFVTIFLIFISPFIFFSLILKNKEKIKNLYSNFKERGKIKS